MPYPLQHGHSLEWVHSLYGCTLHNMHKFFQLANSVHVYSNCIGYDHFTWCCYVNTSIFLSAFAKIKVLVCQNVAEMQQSKNNLASLIIQITLQHNTACNKIQCNLYTNSDVLLCFWVTLISCRYSHSSSKVSATYIRSLGPGPPPRRACPRLKHTHKVIQFQIHGASNSTSRLKSNDIYAV